MAETRTDITGFLKKFSQGDSVHKFCDSSTHNRIVNILEDIHGENGIEITKPTDAEGRGWVISLATDPHGDNSQDPSADEKHLPDPDDDEAEWNPTDPESGDYGKGLKIPVSTLEFVEEDGLYSLDWVFHFDSKGRLWRVENNGRNLIFAVTREMP